MLANQVILISGSSRGIGAALARGFAKEKSCIVINYRSNDKCAKEVADYCQAEGAEVILAKGDVTTEEGVNKVVNEALDNFGHIDVLINNVFAPFQFNAEKRKKLGKSLGRIMLINFRAV